MVLNARQHRIHFPRRPLIMGIVNINDDSFCGDGTLDPTQALAQAEQMLRDGADIIDIGAESARTNRGAISIEEEVRRLRSFMEQWEEMLRFKVQGSSFKKTESNSSLEPEPLNLEPLLSINTWRSEVVAQVLPLGGDLLNDISALTTPRNAELCAEHGAALLIMHSVGEPKIAHTHVSYDNIMETLDAFFEVKMQLAMGTGLRGEQIILDPGIDFAKQREDNLTIYRDLERLHIFERPILLPVSRKTVIGQVLGQPNPQDRDAGTLACIASGMRRGAQIFRVHNVKAAAQAVKVLWSAQGN